MSKITKQQLSEGANRGRQKIAKNPELFERFKQSLSDNVLTETSYKKVEDFMVEDTNED
jgi:hypothetical protein